MTTLQEKSIAAGAARRPRANAPLRPHVLAAIFRRDFLGYFSNPAGYVFITLFVLVCSWAEFWQPIFFANNLVNLDPLNQWMPFILLFFVPAITMSTWAEERRQGTEELLLTLPARDVEVVLGKYFAAVGILTVAILFLAAGHVPILMYLGRPDAGVLLANYLGYWLVGAMLIAPGMVASIISANVTVAFILGAVFCALPVFARLMGSPTAGATRRFIEGLSVAEQVKNFGEGVVSLSSVIYFVTLAAGLLYVNMVLLGRRHWAGGQESTGRWGHAAARIVAVIAALVSFDVLVEKTMGSWRADVTEERLHTLSPVSRSILKQIPSDRPVFIQAYISPVVPREYVQTRLDLIDTLNDFAAIGGDRVRLIITPTERYSQAARDAEKRFGIKSSRVPTFDNARQGDDEITMGVAFSSALEEVVVPFFDRGLPVEYEVARSIRVASGEKRKKVGILATDARLLGGVNFEAMVPEGEWAVVTELKKQYDVTTISADAPIPTDLDALIVAQPSSMPQRQIDNLTKYVRAGGPTLLLMDPYPQIDRDLVPSEPRRPPGGMFAQGPQPEPKGRLQPLLDAIGISWPSSEIVWNNFNPHKQLQVPPEIIFIDRSENPSAFGRDPICAGLQEVVMIVPGELRPTAGAKTEFLPLLRTDELGGVITYQELMTPNQFGGGLNPSRSYVPGLQPYTLAARIRGRMTPAPGTGDGKTPTKPAEARVIAIADLDFIADNFFDLRKKTREGLDFLDFDNVTFMLNCVDTLAGDETFIPLRNRRAKHRTLETVEEASKQYVKRAEDEAKSAKDEAKAQLADAQKRLDAQVAEVQASKELDVRTKEATVRNRRTVEENKLAVAGLEIADRERRRIEDARVSKEEAIQRIQNGIRAWALFLPPLPALLLGGFVFFARARGENRGASANRLA